MHTHPEQLGIWYLAQGSHLSHGIESGENPRYSPLSHQQFLTEPRFEPTTSGYKSDALSIRPRLPHNKAACQPSLDPSRIHYVLENGFLFPSVPDGLKGPKFQLVKPTCLRGEFLEYAHDNPLSGHLGHLKTLLQLMEFAYSPSLRADTVGQKKYLVSHQLCKFSHLKI